MVSLSLSNMDAGFSWAWVRVLQEGHFLQSYCTQIKEKYAKGNEKNQINPDEERFGTFPIDPFIASIVSKATQDQKLTKSIVPITHDWPHEAFQEGLIAAGYFKSPRTSQDYIIVGIDEFYIDCLEKLDEIERSFLFGSKERSVQPALKSIENIYTYAVHHEIGHMAHGHQSFSTRFLDLGLLGTAIGSSLCVGKKLKDVVKSYMRDGLKKRVVGWFVWLVGTHSSLTAARALEAYRNRIHEKNADAFATIGLVESGQYAPVFEWIAYIGKANKTEKVLQNRNGGVLFSSHPQTIDRARSAISTLQRYGINPWDEALLPTYWDQEKKKQYFDVLDTLSEFKQEEKIKKQ